ISESLARQLFPAGHAIGQAIRMSPDAKAGDGHAMQVIGIVNDTLRSAVTAGGIGRMHNVVVLPFQPDAMPVVAFMVRVEPQRRAAVARRLPEVLGDALGLAGGDRVDLVTYEEARAGVMHSHKL